MLARTGFKKYDKWFYISSIFLLLIVTKNIFANNTQTLDKVVAVVNEDVITESELKTQTELIRRQLASKGVKLPSEDVLRKQVLQHLIDVDVQLQLAKTYGVTIDANELDNAINKVATDNHLTLTMLREELDKQGISWETYRENFKKEMIISRMQQKAVGSEIDVSPQQVEDYLKKSLKQEQENHLYHVQNILIPLSEEPTTQELTRAQNRAKLLLNKIRQGADFAMLAVSESSDEYALEGGDLGERHLAELPDIFATKVVNMKPGEVSGPIRAGNGLQIIKLLNSSKPEDKHQITKTHVRHILLKQDVSMTSDEALKQVNSLYEQLKSGKDFALMAKQYSLDPASAANGGDLGWVVPDELVKPFAEEMEKLPLHTISKPVKSQFGWHLIEVLERKTIDDSDAYKRQQVRMFLYQRKFSEAVQSWQQHIRTQSYINVVDKALA